MWVCLIWLCFLPCRSLWLCLMWVLLLGLFDLPCQSLWFFFFLKGGVGGCEFVPVVVVGVVAAVVVVPLLLLMTMRMIGSN